MQIDVFSAKLKNTKLLKVKILANPGLAYLGFEQPSPEVILVI